MPLRLRMPYKIVATREKRYDSHYQIPSSECVIVPVKQFDDEALCDIRWEDGNGEIKVMHNKMFLAENLLPLNRVFHTKLFELWKHYYQEPADSDSSK